MGPVPQEWKVRVGHAQGQALQKLQVVALTSRRWRAERVCWAAKMWACAHVHGRRPWDPVHRAGGVHVSHQWVLMGSQCPWLPAGEGIPDGDGPDVKQNQPGGDRPLQVSIPWPFFHVSTALPLPSLSAQRYPSLPSDRVKAPLISSPMVFGLYFYCGIY